MRLWFWGVILFPVYLIQAGPPIEKVILWGHKLHSHTHSYIHERFFRAFQYLGYPTYWFDNNDDVKDFDFAHSLFITEGQVDQQIPLRFDCQYVLHNCHQAKYKELLEASRCIVMQIYTDELLSQKHLVQVEPFVFYDIPGRCVWFPWASDYLPDEIEMLKEQLIKGLPEKDRCVNWIGTIGSSATPFGNSSQIAEFQRACMENGIVFKHFDPWAGGLDRSECTDRIMRGCYAPAIVGTWQEQNGYIPCRIFINICCGQMGITNSYRTYEFFGKKIVYNPDCYQLFYDAKEREKTWTLQDQLELMDFIKTKHTYINRINALLDFIAAVN